MAYRHMGVPPGEQLVVEPAQGGPVIGLHDRQAVRVEVTDDPGGPGESWPARPVDRWLNNRRKLQSLRFCAPQRD
jgi:hypothetical protein